MDEIYLYYVSSLIRMSSNNLYKIEELLHEGEIYLEDALNVGIDNFDKKQFLKRWEKYLYSKYNVFKMKNKKNKRRK